MILLLLDTDSQSRDNIIKYIKKTIEKTKKDNHKHDFSMLFGNFVFSFIADTKRTELAAKVQANGKLKKYKHKMKIWLAMGRDVNDPTFLLNEYAYLDYDWEYNPIMERMKRYLGSGTRVKLD